MTVFQPPPAEELTVPQVVQKVEALVPPVERIVSPQVTHKNGQFTLTPKVKAEIKKLRWRKRWTSSRSLAGAHCISAVKYCI